MSATPDPEHYQAARIRDGETVTIDDAMGRHWTIITERAVVGTRWTVYAYTNYRHGRDPAALELLYPGGVSNGWIERDDVAARVLLVYAMGLFGVVAPREGDPS